MPKSKLSAFLYLLGVFLSGAVVGALAYRLSTAPHPKPSPEEARRQLVSELTAKLHLDNQQVGDVNRIMDETRDAWHQLRDNMNQQGHKLHDLQWEKVKNLLRPDQKPLYDQWQAEREAERHRREQQQPHPDKK